MKNFNPAALELFGLLAAYVFLLAAALTAFVVVVNWAERRDVPTVSDDAA